MALLTKIKKLFKRRKKKGGARYPTLKKKRRFSRIFQSRFWQWLVGPFMFFSAPLRWFYRRFIKPYQKRIIIVLGLLFMVFWFTLPSISNIDTAKKTPSILLKAADGQIIGSYGDVYGDYVPFTELPESLKDAVVATEDRNFYYHLGIDPIGLTRAAYVNFRTGKVVQGGSTITQQLAKNLFLTPERSFLRKFREMLLAFKLEAHYSKKEILTIYLNRVYLGSGSFGVDAASRRYFGKPAKEMNLAESAILVGLLKAPSRYAPTSNPVLARKRAEQVLFNMKDAEFLSKKQLARGKEQLAETLDKREKSAQSAWYFSDWISDLLPEYVGNVEEDIVVNTTLDPKMQNAAEEAIKGVMDKQGAPMHASQSAMVAMTPDGAVKAMVGGRSYAESQYNRAVQAHRQPGSSFKMFVYLTGVEGGLTPDTMVEDAPITVGKWSPSNYDGQYRGMLPVREAIAQSLNSVAVRISEAYGRNNVVATAQRLGITSELHPDPSIALGSNEVTLIEMVTAYAHLAAEGEAVQPYGVTAITTASGKKLYQRVEMSRNMVLTPDVVGVMNTLLSGVITSGTGRGASIGRSAAGKTGTTSDYKDAWFIGYTPDLVAGVWVGNDDNTPMKKVTGGTLPAPIWREFMRVALAGIPAHNLPLADHLNGDSSLPWRTPALMQPDGATGNVNPEGAVERAPSEETQGGSPMVDDVPLGDGFWEKLRNVGR